uniref:Wall-associated receptor kinase galacturonan-binding domain-containing protein n=1 Tax=Musa balbisiana TaxID=52838 RepID=B5RHV6_MUSBA|nr:uncharacterized protein [Musa balbisiana]
MLLQTTTAAAPVPPPPNVLLPHCKETCGGISIPYPFGIGDGCFREGFEVTCKVANGSATPRAFLGGSKRNITDKDISLLQGQARILNDIAWDRLNSTGQVVDPNAPHLELSGLPFRVSDTRNLFTTLGCNVLGVSKTYVVAEAGTTLHSEPGASPSARKRQASQADRAMAPAVKRQPSRRSWTIILRPGQPISTIYLPTRTTAPTPMTSLPTRTSSPSTSLTSSVNGGRAYA